MTQLAENILTALPRLRRYAGALTGSLHSGDQYIRVALETLLQEPWRIRPDADVKFKLYELFHDVLSACNSEPVDLEPVDDADPYCDLKRGLQGLPPLSKKVLLLVTLEGSVERAAAVLDLPEHEVRLRLAWARQRLRKQQGRSDRAPRLDRHRDRRGALH